MEGESLMSCIRVTDYEAWPIVDATNDHALKGTFHNGLATLLNCRGVAEKREDYIDQSLIEFAAASFHFEQAGHVRYRARVENNLGYLFFTVKKFSGRWFLGVPTRRSL